MLIIPPLSSAPCESVTREQIVSAGAQKGVSAVSIGQRGEGPGLAQLRGPTIIIGLILAPNRSRIGRGMRFWRENSSAALAHQIIHNVIIILSWCEIGGLSSPTRKNQKHNARHQSYRYHRYAPILGSRAPRSLFFLRFLVTPTSPYRCRYRYILSQCDARITIF